MTTLAGAAVRGRYPRATPARPIDAVAAAAHRRAVREPLPPGAPAGVPGPSPLYPFVVGWHAVVDVMSGVLADNPGVAPTPVHLSQDVHLVRPLRGDELVYATADLGGARRHGTGAQLAVRTWLHDRDGVVIASLTTGALLAGARRPEPFGEWPRPWSGRRSEPVATSSLALPDDVALRYAEVSGDRNPLHLDAEQARAAGFDRPLAHGMCVLAVACEAVVDQCAGGDPSRVRGVGARFARPVHPGDRLDVAIHATVDGRVPFAVTTAGRPALKSAWIELRGGDA